LPGAVLFTECNEYDSHGVTDAMMMQVTTGVTSVVDLATNRSDVYAPRWSRRRLRSVIDWSAVSTKDRIPGARILGAEHFRGAWVLGEWTTEREPEEPSCD